MSNPIDNPQAINEAHSDSQVTLAAPGVGKRHYLVDLTVKSDAICVVTVQSPAGINKFRISLAANEGASFSWLRGKRGALNEAMVIDVSAGTFDINYDSLVGD